MRVSTRSAERPEQALPDEPAGQDHPAVGVGQEVGELAEPERRRLLDAPHRRPEPGRHLEAPVAEERDQAVGPRSEHEDRAGTAFEPRLVGPVLEGTADEHSAVCLHLHDDGADRVAMFLQEKGIPYEERTRRLRLERDTTADVPVFVFSAGDSAIDLTVLPYDRLRQAPLDRIDEKPMRRANLPAVEELVRSGSAAND